MTRAYALFGAGSAGAVPSPVPVAAPSTVNAVQCGSNNGCTIIGSANGVPYAKTFAATVDLVGKLSIVWLADPTLPSLSSVYTLKSITCADARCFIAGYFTLVGGAKRPYLATSTNQGQTWTSITPPALPVGATSVAYNGVSCANKYQCRAVGEVTISGVTSPYTATFSANLIDSSATPAGTWTGQTQAKGTGVASASLNATSCVTVGTSIYRTAQCADVGTGTTTAGATAPVGIANILWTA